MSTHRLYELAAEITSRRRFLGKVGAATLASVGAVIGLPTTALATFSYACCNLCKQAGPASCSGCSWCWTCVEGTHTYQCCECHSPSNPCDASCNNVINSWYTQISGCCGPGTPSIEASSKSAAMK